MRTTTVAIVFVTSALCGGQLSLAENLIDATYGIGAGSFELGNFNNTDADLRPEYMLVTPGMVNITGWSVEGTSGVHWMTSAVENPTDGDKTVDLQGLSGPPFSSLFTSIPTIPGAAYDLSFDAHAGSSAQNLAFVSAGSLINQPFSGIVRVLGQPHVYTPFGYEFTALSPLTTLRFSVQNSDGYGPVIDRVAVSPVVPAPGAMLLVTVGAGLVGWLRRHRMV